MFPTTAAMAVQSALLPSDVAAKPAVAAAARTARAYRPLPAAVSSFPAWDAAAPPKPLVDDPGMPVTPRLDEDDRRALRAVERIAATISLQPLIACRFVSAVMDLPAARVAESITRVGIRCIMMMSDVGDPPY